MLAQWKVVRTDIEQRLQIEICTLYSRVTMPAGSPNVAKSRPKHAYDFHSPQRPTPGPLDVLGFYTHIHGDCYNGHVDMISWQTNADYWSFDYLDLHGTHILLYPPSTGIPTPVIQEASSLHKNSAALAMSCSIVRDLVYKITT